MYLRSFEIRNFMSHRRSDVEFAPLTLFVGPNGGGKSALFDALLNFSMLARGNLQQTFGPYPFSYRATLHHGARSVERIGFRASMSIGPLSEEYLEYSINYSQTGNSESRPEFTIHDELLTKQPGGVCLFNRSDVYGCPLEHLCPSERDRSIFSPIRTKILASETDGIDPLVLDCVRDISRFNKFRLDPHVLSAPSRFPETTTDAVIASPRLGYNGEDLPGTLYYLAQVNDGAFQSIKEKIRELDETVEDFEFNMLGSDRVGFSLVYTDSRGTVPAVRLSTGVLSFIGLVTLLSSPGRPAVLMLEEPENGLTPQASKLFYDCASSLAQGKGGCGQSQVVISSHSPSLICGAWPTDVRDAIHQVKVLDGASRIKRFSEVVRDNGAVLAKERDGERNHLGLKTAEEVMSGYLS